MAVSVQEHRKNITRRTFLKGGAALAAVGFPLYAAEISRHEISIERHSIRIERLPDQFRGMRIVQISDFHYAEYTEPYFLREIVELVNRLKPDMTVFNGDFITNGLFPQNRTKAFAYKCTEILSHVQCPLRYSVLGNHDATEAFKDTVIDALATHKMPLLNNAFAPLERDGKRLWIAGTGDVCCNQMDLNKAIPPSSLTDGEPVILMVHEPDVLPQIARYKVDLMLSGHTHGGQIRLPFLPALSLPEFGKRYVEGLFRVGPTQLYVNRGIGTVGLPFRFNCPPEIAEITLA